MPILLYVNKFVKEQRLYERSMRSANITDAVVDWSGSLSKPMCTTLIEIRIIYSLFIEYEQSRFIEKLRRKEPYPCSSLVHTQRPAV